ncbi:hypothetical protein BJ122_102221 [Rhodopseudomonas faecalis]|uniref:Uncharacterized protein n=1 Tax=Rhodopseudomonas faecalis TaxID=99655 RepID=A0A318TT20_9BRAD|nr:hypothetical protein BJ122_102221 [Rhodopseudomonas faecalis]
MDYSLREAFADLLEFAVDTAVEKHKARQRADEQREIAQEEVRRRSCAEQKAAEHQSKIDLLEAEVGRYVAKFGPLPTNNESAHGHK